MIRKFITGMAIGSAIFMLSSLFKQLQRPAPSCWTAKPIEAAKGLPTRGSTPKALLRMKTPPLPVMRLRPPLGRITLPPMDYPEGPDWEAWVAAQAARKAARKAAGLDCSRCGFLIDYHSSPSGLCGLCEYEAWRIDEERASIKRPIPRAILGKRAPLNWNPRGSQ